ncbi:unnamed protein product [Periconia digitata]|uniref:Uncharacterized protein n=1 Tax=Periconia digitata TaxID=1303443 RepID=A0A9W4UPY8_9PLEO|nr:unnamed protein product [Periconia digitata]
MRSPPIACRRAVHSFNPNASSPHIWISDDLLSCTVTHFFRAVCPHQKRHGSHVPGPLEAQRRAAKRKMTAQATYHDSEAFTPPSFNLRALFAAFRQRREPQWTYEPPSLSHLPIDSSNVSSSLPALEPPVCDTPDALSAPTLESPAYDDSITTVHITTETQSRPRDAYTCFHDFKTHLDLADLSRAAAPRESLLHLFDAHSPSASADACDYVIFVLRYLSTVQCERSLILSLLAAERVALPGIYTPGGLELLQTIDAMFHNVQEHPRLLLEFYRKLARLNRNAKGSKGPRQDLALRLLIRGLWGAEAARNRTLGTTAWAFLRNLCEKLSASQFRTHLLYIFNGPAYIAMPRFGRLMGPHLRSEDKHAIHRIVVKVLECVPHNLVYEWAMHLFPNLNKGRAYTAVQRFIELTFQIDRRSDQLKDGVSTSLMAFHRLVSSWVNPGAVHMPQHLVLYALLNSLISHHSWDGKRTTRLLLFIETYMRDADTDTLDSLPFDEILPELLHQLNESLLPNHGVIELMIPHIYRKHGLPPVLDLLGRIADRGIPLSNTSFLADFVKHRTQELKQYSKTHHLFTERERQRYIVLLAACKELRVKVASLGTANLSREVYKLRSEQFFNFILERARDNNILPLAYRDVNIYTSIQTRVALLAQLANQYSLDPSLTPRQSWRSIYTMYKYIKNSAQKPPPLFIKAVVESCIARPLSARYFVSARRLQWVLRLVEEVEGLEAAQKLENDFWHRRGDLIALAKRRLKDSGGHGRVHVSTLRRLGLFS